MPTLNWIGKDAVEHHHAEVPYRLVHCDGELSAGDPDAGNLLVQGDNLEALKALLPYYGGRVKCIYIDPPYNTGNEGWVYNDNVASPEIKAWLGKVVGKEAEDLSRHDKWLCMMYPRLRLLREFLREDGVFVVSIDDTELHHATLLSSEIFGSHNHIGNIVWNKKASPANDATYFSGDHEYLCVFAKNAKVWRPNRQSHNERQLKNYSNPDSDRRGAWNSAALTCAKTADERPNLYFPILNPNTGEEIWPRRTRVWAYGPDMMAKLIDENRLYWGKDGASKSPRIKKFLCDAKPVVPRSVWGIDQAGSTQNANTEIREIFGDIAAFPTPKTSKLLEKLISICSDPGDLILDSFAGSGTTGHSVLSLNRKSGSERKFILVEMDETIAPKITAERLRRVIDGYDKGGDPEKPVEGLGGGFRYCRLGVPLFNEFGDIDTAVAFPDLAAHIFFAETSAPIPSKASGNSSYLGKHGDKAVYLLFAPGQEGTPRETLGNVLTPDALTALPAPPDGFEGARVVYAEGTTVSPDRLKAEGVVFKQIPYQIEGA